MSIGDLDEDTAQPLVSVIVPTHNNANTLDRCLHSVKSQTYADIELIVVDRSSCDQTIEIAERYGARVLRGGKERCAQANVGVRAASGSYVLRLDADFILAPDVVSQCVRCAIEAQADCVAIHNTPDATMSWIARLRKFEVDMYRFDRDHVSARFVRRDLYLEIGGMDEELIAGEDYDFQNRLNRSGALLGFIEAEATHIGEPTSFVAHLRKCVTYGRQFNRYVEKNPDRPRGQLGLGRRTFVRHWRYLLGHPLKTILLAGYLMVKFGAGGLGFSWEWIRRKTVGPV